MNAIWNMSPTVYNYKFMQSYYILHVTEFRHILVREYMHCCFVDFVGIFLLESNDLVYFSPSVWPFTGEKCKSFIIRHIDLQPINMPEVRSYSEYCISSTVWVCFSFRLEFKAQSIVMCLVMKFKTSKTNVTEWYIWKSIVQSILIYI